MRPEALVDLATELLRQVLRFELPAESAVAAFFRRHREPGPRERLALVDTVYEVLRRKRLYAHLAETSPVAPNGRERRLVLLAWQGRTADLETTLDAEGRAWRDRALAGALVGSSALPSADVAAADRRSSPGDALRHNLPDWLADALQASAGEAFWPLAASLVGTAPLDVRINRVTGGRDEARAALADEGVAAEPTPYSPLGLRVAGRPVLTRLGAFERGLIEVQDEGSQLLALAVGARRGEMVADFCAGGGGKTLALGAEMRNTGRLYAFDTSGHRLAALQPRLARSGLTNVHPAQIAHERDARVDRLAGKLDRVLVDAPCSGLGTLRRHPDLKWRQTPQTVAAMQARQAAILAAAARLVRPGGRLVYATCSLLSAENDAIVAAFDAAQGRDFEPLAAADALARTKVAAAATLVDGRFLRLWPHRHGTDGFYAAFWQRR